MAITLGTYGLPDGLVWEDELAWSPLVQSSDYGLDGALILEESTRQAGRPITLRGSLELAWMDRESLLALKAALEAEAAELTLTLHDKTTHLVTGRHDGNAGPIEAYPVPVLKEYGYADPDKDTLYWISRVRLLEL